MKKIYTTVVTTLLCSLMSCCSSVGIASLGAGATAGKDYVTGLRPSAAARQYFTSMPGNAPVETVSRGNAGSRSGVRFRPDGGIVIPAGVTISFTNKGYCMDPHLPAPVADEEYQFVPASALIPNQLMGTYQNLLSRYAAGDAEVRSNMQTLVWALRTAGTNGDTASRLSDSQKRILDKCSSRPGEFQRIHESGLITSRLISKAWEIADSHWNVKVAGRTWKPSDFSSQTALTSAVNDAVNTQMNNLMLRGKNLPIQRTGFNYGELESGIYTDVRGAGYLTYTAKIANSTNQEYIFYPTNYVAQVGSGSVLSAVSFGASSIDSKRQRVTGGQVLSVNIIAHSAPVNVVNSPSDNDKARGHTEITVSASYNAKTHTITPSVHCVITLPPDDEIPSSTVKINGVDFDISKEMQKQALLTHEELGHKSFAEQYPYVALYLYAVKKKVFKKDSLYNNLVIYDEYYSIRAQRDSMADQIAEKYPNLKESDIQDALDQEFFLVSKTEHTQVKLTYGEVYALGKKMANDNDRDYLVEEAKNVCNANATLIYESMKSVPK